MKELHTLQITEFREKHRRRWKEHVERINADGIPKTISKYQLKGEKVQEDF
jgi:hypothetical protein